MSCSALWRPLGAAPPERRAPPITSSPLLPPSVTPVAQPPRRPLRFADCLTFSSLRSQSSRHDGRLVSTGAASREVPWLDKQLDDSLSNRWLDLDPKGYFIIKLDRQQRLIVADHYTNTINKNGVACDEATGKPIPCTPGSVRQPSRTFTGRTAKELSVKVLEEAEEVPLSLLVHANYLGREFQRAEEALRTGDEYIQD